MFSKFVYAAFGPSKPGLDAPSIPIQAAASADPLSRPPGVIGYSLNVVDSSGVHPVMVSRIFVNGLPYNIAGTTLVQPVDVNTNVPIPFYGSISHGLDGKITDGKVGGNGVGAMIKARNHSDDQSLSYTFPSTNGDRDYTFNAITSSVVDSTGEFSVAGPGKYFNAGLGQDLHVAVISTPTFMFHGQTYNVDISTTPYTLLVGEKRYTFTDRTNVTAGKTNFSNFT